MADEVTIRETLESDWPILFENQRDPVSSAMAGVPAREWDAYIAHQRKISADETGLRQTILYDGQIAGDLVSFLRDGRREVGYRINREYWGKGIATWALALFLQVERRRPLYGWVLAQNIGSQRVLEKCGFTVIGEEHEDGDHGIVFMLSTPTDAANE
ncbi:MAG TPA: GNAT family N-acetyltransferase [Ktedonobacterales bacterium]|jgi:RimJ/RimL family protein N-acetyltransferase